MDEIIARRLDKYEIVAEIGSGGFGTVYRARDTDLDRHVALKVLHPSLLDNPAFVERFRREAKAAANLEHPHIVTVYEVGEVEGRHFIAMRLLEGQSLRQLLTEQQGPLPPEEALPILENVAAALDHAHERGVIHRDVKPSNIIVTPTGAVLTDFGIVRVLGDETRMTATGQAMGTPEYMAPEQILGQEVSPQTDVYALGVIAYQMLAGQTPFTGKTPFAVQEGHVRGAVPAARTVNPGLPEAVDGVLERALDKTYGERYASASEMIAMLHSVFAPAVSDYSASETVIEEEPSPAVAPIPEPVGVSPPDTPVPPVTKFVPAPSVVSPSRPPASPSPPATCRSRIGVFLGIVGIVVVGLGACGLFVLLAWLFFDFGSIGSFTSPSSAVQPTAPAHILFQDNFSDSNSGWEVGDYDDGDVGYKDGAYFVTSVNLETLMWGVAGRSFDDVIIEVDATQVTAGPTNDNAYGVACREQDGSGDGYYLRISGDGYYSIAKAAGGEFTALVEWAESSAIKQGNATNHIRAMCNSATLALFVNGQRVATVVDSTFASGDIALTATTYEEGMTEVHFDNLVVRRP